MKVSTYDRLEASAYTVIVLSALILALACALGCANKRHAVAVSSMVVAESLFAIQDAEEAGFALGKVTPAQHRRFNQHLVVALTLGREYNAAVRAWQPGTPLPAQLAGLRDALARLMAEIGQGWPDDLKTQILALIGATYDAVLAVLVAAGS